MFDWLKKRFSVGDSLYNSPGWSGQRWGYGRSQKGEPPTSEELSTLAGVNRCCTLFSDSTASQKWTVAQDRPTGGMFTITGSDAGNAISEWAYGDREQWIFSAALLGNGYAVVHRNDRGGAGRIETVSAWRVSLEWTDSQSLVYRIAEDESEQQAERIIQARDMLHLKFRQTGRHSLLGVSPLTQLAPALAPMFLVRQGVSQIFNWITLPGSYFQSDDKLNAEQIGQIRDAIETRQSGKPVILGSGMSMKEVPIPKLDALQTMELSRWGIEEIARCWGVPTSMLSQSEGVNYSSAAEQSRQFTTISLQPFATRVQSCLSQALLTREERLAGRHVYIDLLPLVLGHGSERSEYFSRMVNSGVYTPNEARNQSGLSDIDGGDELRAPLNTAPLDSWNNPPEQRGGTTNVIKLLERVK